MKMIEEILLFSDLINVGSFIKLSDKSGISQPTISRKIQALEEEYGTLLIRTSHGIRLTDNGNKFYSKSLELKQNINNWFRNFNDAEDNQINILLPEWMGQTVVKNGILPFLKNYPNIRLNIKYGDRLVDFIKENLDFAITSVQPKQSFQIAKFLDAGKIIYYCRHDYIKKDDLPENLEKLGLEHKFLAVNQDPILELKDNQIPQSRYLHTNDQHLETMNISADLILSDYVTAQQIMHSNNQFISVTYESLIQEQLSTGYFIPVMRNTYAKSISYQIIMPERIVNDYKKNFLNLLLENINLSVAPILS